MLNTIKTLLGLEDDTEDSLIQVLISSAINEALNYCHIDDFIPELEATIIDMVIFKYNRLKAKADGVDSESYSGVSMSYSKDYPEAILRQLKAYRKVIFK